MVRMKTVNAYIEAADKEAAAQRARERATRVEALAETIVGHLASDSESQASDIAKRAYDIAEAMVCEYEARARPLTDVPDHDPGCDKRHDPSVTCAQWGGQA